MKCLKRHGVLVSINPPYTNLIFSGEKPMEFRRKVLNSMLLNTEDHLPLFVYETKNKGGCGAVVGEAFVSKVYRVYYGKPDNFWYHPSRHACLIDLYFQWLKKHEYELSDRDKNLAKPWEDAVPFLRYCEKIGYSEKSDFNYAVCLRDVKLYQNTMELGEFLDKRGNPMGRPPQNMCYTYEEVDELCI